MNKKFITIGDEPMVDLSVISAIERANTDEIHFTNVTGECVVYWEFDTPFIRDKIYNYLQLKYSDCINITDVEGLDKLTTEELFDSI